ncbi:MAG: hypothetical protein ACI81V_000426 [Lentimonas sp.]|jgi:hypothetical protein
MRPHSRLRPHVGERQFWQNSPTCRYAGNFADMLKHLIRVEDLYDLKLKD